MDFQIAGRVFESVDRCRTVCRDALRGLSASPSATFLAFGVLVLTMAAGTVTFSVVDGIALRPLPYHAPGDLVGISAVSRESARPLLATARNYFMWIKENQAFQSIGAARVMRPLQLQDANIVDTVVGKSVTSNLFDVLGIRPTVGRFFGPEHEQPGGPLGVILSYSYWSRRFNHDPRVIGRTVALDGQRTEIIGVLPSGVYYPPVGEPSDIYIPFVTTPTDRMEDRGASLFVVGRLRNEVSIEEARADIARVSSSRVLVLPLHEQVVGAARRPLLLVLAAVGLVLLVACVNVASLLLARATTRSSELATRQALGASRAELAAGLLVEGVILSLAAAGCGLLISFGAIEVVKAALPAGLARVPGIALNGRVFLVLCVVATLTGLAFASIPAWFSARTPIGTVLTATAGPIVVGRPLRRALTGFLVADIAFVTVLLVGTVVVVTSFILVTTTDLGFDRHNVLTLSYTRRLTERPEFRPAAAIALREDIISRVRAVPGVVAVAISTNASSPLAGNAPRYDVRIPGPAGADRQERVLTRMVTKDYFRVLNMRLAKGRLFETSDHSMGAPSVALLNDAAGRKLFPDVEPVGQLIAFRGPTSVIGILEDIHANGPEVEVLPEMYLPAEQEPATYLTGSLAMGSVVVRTSGQSSILSTGIREAIRLAVPGQEPPAPRYLDEYYRTLTAARRFNAQLMGVFGVMAMAIGLIGVFGTMTFVVQQQRRVIGLSIALGASPSAVGFAILRRAFYELAVGTGIGLMCAWNLSALLTSVAVGVSPTSMTVYMFVAALLITTGGAAAVVPAIRAARLDPILVLRQQ